MTKFIEQVTASLYEPRSVRFRQEPIKELLVDQKYTTVPLEQDVKYRVGVCWERFVYARPEELAHIKDSIIDELKHDIYGEFIRDLLRLRSLILARDIDKAGVFVSKILKDVT